MQAGAERIHIRQLTHANGILHGRPVSGKMINPVVEINRHHIGVDAMGHATVEFDFALTVTASSVQG